MTNKHTTLRLFLLQSVLRTVFPYVFPGKTTRKLSRAKGRNWGQKPSFTDGMEEQNYRVPQSRGRVDHHQKHQEVIPILGVLLEAAGNTREPSDV